MTALEGRRVFCVFVVNEEGVLTMSDSEHCSNDVSDFEGRSQETRIEVSLHQSTSY